MKFAILLAILALSSAQYVYRGVGGGYPGAYPGQQVVGYPSNYNDGIYQGGQAFGFRNSYPYGGYNNDQSGLLPQVARSPTLARTISTQGKYVAQQASPYATYPYGAISQYPGYPTAGQFGGVAAPGIGANGVYFSSPSYQYSY